MSDSVIESNLFLDLAPQTDAMEQDVWLGMNRTPRSLPSKYFYDATGSVLFDRICELEEYYPTRTESAILKRILPELEALFSDPLIMLEYGSGSSMKTQLLLEHVAQIRGYIPIDISREHLLATARFLATRFPDLNILPVCADYGQQILFDDDDARLGSLTDARRMVFFPGSTIGNFERASAVQFLRRIHTLLGAEGYLLIGVDLLKDVEVLRAAYNDREGVTAAFNKNILEHVNRRLGSNFDPDTFRHEAIWDEASQRIEMRLVAEREVRIELPQGSVNVENGSHIRTEYSHKYSIEGFSGLATESGFEVRNVWTDPRNWFSVQLLQAV